MITFFKNGILLFLFLFFIKNGNAQEKIIHGIVPTFDSISVVHAEVIVKSSKRIFISDTLGRFAAVCANEDKLKIVANGFNNQSIKLNNDTKIAKCTCSGSGKKYRYC